MQKKKTHTKTERQEVEQSWINWTPLTFLRPIIELRFLRADRWVNMEVLPSLLGICFKICRGSGPGPCRVHCFSYIPCWSAPSLQWTAWYKLTYSGSWCWNSNIPSELSHGGSILITYAYLITLEAPHFDYHLHIKIWELNSWVCGIFIQTAEHLPIWQL